MTKMLLTAHVAGGSAALVSMIIPLVSRKGGRTLRAPTTPMHWWYEHMNQMIGACIAATTAFVVNNAGHLGLPGTSLTIWLGPAALGVPAGIIWTTYYRRRFAGAMRHTKPNEVAARIA